MAANSDDHWFICVCIPGSFVRVLQCGGSNFCSDENELVGELIEFVLDDFLSRFAFSFSRAVSTCVFCSRFRVHDRARDCAKLTQKRVHLQIGAIACTKMRPKNASGDGPLRSSSKLIRAGKTAPPAAAAAAIAIATYPAEVLFSPRAAGLAVTAGVLFYPRSQNLLSATCR
jgi:hypothetical protein